MAAGKDANGTRDQSTESSSGGKGRGIPNAVAAVQSAGALDQIEQRRRGRRRCRFFVVIGWCVGRRFAVYEAEQYQIEIEAAEQTNVVRHVADVFITAEIEGFPR